MDLKRLAIAGVLTLGCTAAAAAELEVKQYQGVRYVTGGVGAEEQEAIRQAASEYTLGLTFAGKNGRYVSGVQVTVKKAGGETVLSAVSDGPLLLADLPAGRYTVEASYQGETHTRQVSLGDDRHRRVVMSWSVPEPDAAPGRNAPRGAT